MEAAANEDCVLICYDVEAEGGLGDPYGEFLS
jgi:hypothetical protein